MGNINSKTIENVSITEVKELDEFLKLYNKFRDLSENETQQQVLQTYMGKLSENDYINNIKRLKEYTKSSTIPTETEWSEIRAQYREVGNKKISSSKERLEDACKQYSGTCSVCDSDVGTITLKQAVLNLDHANRNVVRLKRLKTIVSMMLGIAGFVMVIFLVRMLNLKGVGFVGFFISGLGALLGLGVGVVVAQLLFNGFIKSKKQQRDKAEVIVAQYHEQIVKLQTEIKSAEENIKKVEQQYGVEILAVTDFAKKKENKKKKQKETETKK